MKVSEFLDRLEAAANMPTLYAMGTYGHVLTDDQSRARVIAANGYNEKPARVKMIMDAHKGTFCFDCSGLVKGILWGFSGDQKKPYGGAKYAGGGVPDLNAAGLIDVCKNVRSAEACLVPGELLYMPGHCGIYAGADKVIECSPKWENGVQITDIHARKWKKCGLLPYIDYAPFVQKVYTIPAVSLRRGSRGMGVLQLQECLNALGAALAEDARFGPKTESALKALQARTHIRVDGIYGPQTKAALMAELEGGKNK